MKQRIKKSTRNISTLLIFAALAAILLLTGRKKTTTPIKDTATTGNRITIAATFYPLYIMLMNITDDVPGVQIQLCASQKTDNTNTILLTPDGVKTATASTILVRNGGSIENLPDNLLANKKGNIIVASEEYDFIDNNPCIWLSPEGAQYEVRRIMKGLSERDSGYSSLYIKNGLAYILKLQTLDSQMHSELDSYEGTAIIPLSTVFPYLAATFNLNPLTYSKRNQKFESQTADINHIIAFIRKEKKERAGICLIAETQYAETSAKAINSATGLSVYRLDPATDGIQDKNAYINAMKSNTAVLKAGLSEAAAKTQRSDISNNS